MLTWGWELINWIGRGNEPLQNNLDKNSLEEQIKLTIPVGVLANMLKLADTDLSNKYFGDSYKTEEIVEKQIVLNLSYFFSKVSFCNLKKKILSQYSVTESLITSENLVNEAQLDIISSTNEVEQAEAMRRVFVVIEEEGNLMEADLLILDRFLRENKLYAKYFVVSDRYIKNGDGTIITMTSGNTTTEQNRFLSNLRKQQPDEYQTNLSFIHRNIYYVPNANSKILTDNMKFAVFIKKYVYDVSEDKFAFIENNVPREVKHLINYLADVFNKSEKRVSFYKQKTDETKTKTENILIKHNNEIIKKVINYVKLLWRLFIHFFNIKMKEYVIFHFIKF